MWSSRNSSIIAMISRIRIFNKHTKPRTKAPVPLSYRFLAAFFFSSFSTELAMGEGFNSERPLDAESWLSRYEIIISENVRMTEACTFG